MKKTSVLFVISSLNCGGAEKSLISLLQLLDYDKIDVTLMLQYKGGIFEQYVPKCVSIIQMPKASGLGGFIGRCLYAARLRFKLNRHWAETYWNYAGWSIKHFQKKYDVAIAYNQGFPTYYVANRINARRKIAWVNSDLEKAGYNVKFNSNIYAKYDYVNAVSDSMRKLIVNQGYCTDHQTDVVYDILNVDLIKSMAEEQVDMDYRGLKIVTVGRLMPPKNYPLAVETAKLLDEKGVDFHWWFVGGGDEEQSILKLSQQLKVDSKITITGTTGNPYPYMKKADIYVQTSSFEGFCLTLNEARILNRPVISTNFPPAYDQITQNENGIIVEMNKFSLADAILKLAEDHSLRDKLIAGTKREVNLTARTESEKVNKMILN